MDNKPLLISAYCHSFPTYFHEQNGWTPWQLAAQARELIFKKLKHAGSEFKIHGDIAIHKDAQLEEHVILKGPVIVQAGCFIGAHAYLRGGVFLAEKSSIGPGCEIKSSFILGGALAHFNFVGDSILGVGVNLEAGAIIANHFNERTDKKIRVKIAGNRIDTGVEKFGALVGDNTKIGANAVLSPGTILPQKSIVRRLELVDQDGFISSSPEYHF